MKADFKNQKPSFQVPKRNWIRRNPLTFQFITIGSFLLAFFSKPIYDIFIDEPVQVPYLPQRPPPRE